MTRSNAKTEALQLLKKSGAYASPTDLEKIASHLKIRILKEDLDDDISGLLVVKDGKRAIGVNKNHHPNRQRFTIAHEIGHYVLHWASQNLKNDVHFDKKWAYFRSRIHAAESTEERQANQFAAELLMPEELVEHTIKKSKMDLTDDLNISKLAATFQVSEKALTIRLVSLKLIEPY